MYYQLKRKIINCIIYFYRRIFSVWTGSTALHFMVAGAPLAAAHTNSADESTCLMADNIQNIITIQRSQDMLKMLSSLHRYFSQVTVSIKNTGTTILLTFRAHQMPTLT
jgi:hypothetical protein